MMLSIVIVLALLAGLTLFLLRSADFEYSGAEPVECHAKRAERTLRSAKMEIRTGTSQKSEKRETADSLKSAVLEGLNYITSNPKDDESMSQIPHELGQLSQDIVGSIRRQVGDMKEFTSAYELALMLDDPNVNMSEVAKRISADPVLSNKILRAANSAYFGSRMAIDSIGHALAVLGLINIKSILFYNMLYRQSFHEQQHGNPVFRSLWTHAILTARCAVYLADAFEGLNKGKLYTLGLLHDFGGFFMPRISREKQIDRDFMIPFGDRESIACEEQLLGTNHAVIGRIAFEGCGLSEQILRLIEIHHFPSFYAKGYLSMKEEDKKYLTALYLANQIAKLFVDEEEKKYYAVQPLPNSYHNLVNLEKVKNIFSDHRVLSEIEQTKMLTRIDVRS